MRAHRRRSFGIITWDTITIAIGTRFRSPRRGVLLPRTTSGCRKCCTTCIKQGEKDSRIFVPPWLDPIEPNIDPIIVQGMNMLGLSVANDLTAEGSESQID